MIQEAYGASPKPYIFWENCSTDNVSIGRWGVRKIRLPNSVTVRQTQEILNGFEYKLNEIPNFNRMDSLPVTDPQEYDCAQYSIRKQDFGRSRKNQGFPTFYDRSDELFDLLAHFLFRIE